MHPAIRMLLFAVLPALLAGCGGPDRTLFTGTVHPPTDQVAKAFVAGPRRAEPRRVDQPPQLLSGHSPNKGATPEFLAHAIRRAASGCRHGVASQVLLHAAALRSNALRSSRFTFLRSPCPSTSSSAAASSSLLTAV